MYKLLLVVTAIRTVSFIQNVIMVGLCVNLPETRDEKQENKLNFQFGRVQIV